MKVATTSASSHRGSNLQRRAPLFVWFSIAMAVLIVVLPSALNLPQSNPNTVPEFAPVPSDQVAEQSGGNLSSLGVTSSRGLGSGTGIGEDIVGAGKGRRPTTKRCVGNPPRQTSDPLSPPCVGFFVGDNGGAPYQGVTREEVRVLFATYGGGGILCCSGGGAYEVPPTGYIDLAEPPEQHDAVYEDYPFTRMLRMWQRHFNDRYQTYNRFVHFFIHFDGPSQRTPEGRRAVAAEQYERVKPFAVVDYVVTNLAAYLDAMAGKGVLNFVPSDTFNVPGQESRFFTKFPGLIWGFEPPVNERAHNFASYVCSKVVPFKTSFGGNDNDVDIRLHNGEPRRLGLLWSSASFAPELKVYANIVREDVTKCGGTFVSEASVPYYCTGDCFGDPRPGTDNMAKMKGDGVSTIIWAGGAEQIRSKAAAKINYFPEVVLGGDNLAELTLEGQFQDQTFWRNVFAVATFPLRNPYEDTPCYVAAHDVDPQVDQADLSHPGCKMYDSLRQLFTGIQVAGPRLTPSSVDKGYHAIPAVSSNDPRVPACFYEPGDYTCIKDSAVMWWDPAGDDPQSSNPGCMRMMEGGRRYPFGQWPRQDVPVGKQPNDPCNPMGTQY